MTDERFEQLMKQALKPEIDERDVVIQKSTNNYKNRMKRKRRLRVCITAGIAAAACDKCRVRNRQQKIKIIKIL